MRQKPGDGGGMDLEQARRLGGGFVAAAHHHADLGLLLRGKLGAAAPDPALPPGRIHPGPGAFPQHGAFELGEGPHHLHHHATGRAGRVDRLGQAPESGPGRLKPFHEGEHVAQRTRQPVQLPNHHHIAGPQPLQEAVEFGPVPPAA